MSAITIPQTNEQVPFFTNFLSSNSNEDKTIKESSALAAYQTNFSDSSNFFRKNFTWEYFSNELEFE